LQAKATPKARVKYGITWPSTVSDLEIELTFIKWGGNFKSGNERGGMGLLHHYKEAHKLLWPDRYWHRWTELFFKTIIENQVTFAMGCASSQKSSTMSAYSLISYWASPNNTVVLVSSTARDKLEQAIFGEMKKLWKEGKKRYKWLAGHPIEYKQAILTDKLVKKSKPKDGEEDEEDYENLLRDMRRGVVCKACFVGTGASSGGGSYVGLGAFAGIKQENVIFLADELQFMAPTFLDCLPNMRSNTPGIVSHGERKGEPYWGLKVIASGNPNHNPESQMGIAAEPLDGWASVENIEKTTVWPCKTAGSVCLNFIGTDSPNFDQPEDIYPKLIGHEHERQILAQYPKDSPQYEAQIKGRMKMSLAASRVITREICRNGRAHEKAVWKGTERTKIYAVDPAYGGGDRCIAGWIEFGEDMEGNEILRIVPPKTLAISLKDPRSPEDQICQQVKRDMEDHGIPPTHAFYDSFGKGTVGFAMAKEFGATCPVPVNAGEQPSQRPVRYDLFVEEFNGHRRLKRCDEHYSKFITELWFSVREAIEAQQIRELPEDIMAEGCSRQYIIVSGYKIEVENKQDMKKRTGKSPDLFDWLCIAIEGARRHGFKIKRLGVSESEKNTGPKWYEKKREQFRELISSKMLQRA